MVDLQTRVFLAHHGILGMHWGVRKERSASEEHKSITNTSIKKHLSKTERNLLIGGGVTAAAVAILAAGLLSKNTLEAHTLYKITLDELSKTSKFTDSVADGKRISESLEDTIVPKGTTFHRVSSKLETSIDNPKYSTYIDKDVLRYRKDWMTLSGDGKNYFKTTFEANQDVKIASEASMSHLAENIMDNKIGQSDKTLRDLIIEAHHSVSVYGVSDLNEFYGKMPAKDLAKRFVGNAGGAWNDSASKVLLNELSKQGYGGFTDIIDTDVLAKHAVVLINNDMFKTSGTLLTQKEREAASLAMQKLFGEYF